MKSLLTNRKRNASYRPMVLMVVACALLAVPLLSSARPSVSSITVTNNSGRDIRFLYLSPVDADDWSADQLNNASLGNGQSVTLNNVSCSGSQVKVIGEDADGCFVSSVVSCTGGSWTITSDTPADCGTE